MGQGRGQGQEGTAVPRGVGTHKQPEAVDDQIVAGQDVPLKIQAELRNPDEL